MYDDYIEIIIISVKCFGVMVRDIVPRKPSLGVCAHDRTKEIQHITLDRYKYM